MTARRRPLHRDDLDVEQTLKRAVNVAPEIELGWSLLRQAMRDAGWPAKTPDADRQGRTHTPRDGEENTEPMAYALDYGDPTGEQAMRLDALANDLETMQDHWHLVANSLRALAKIARKHVPATDATATEPACSVLSCDGIVERTTSGHGYRGMEMIAGLWVARPGERPVCGAHRKRYERGAA